MEIFRLSISLINVHKMSVTHQLVIGYSHLTFFCIWHEFLFPRYTRYVTHHYYIFIDESFSFYINFKLYQLIVVQFLAVKFSNVLYNCT